MIFILGFENLKYSFDPPKLLRQHLILCFIDSDIFTVAD